MLIRPWCWYQDGDFMTSLRVIVMPAETDFSVAASSPEEAALCTMQCLGEAY